jgi:nucleotide-binding universal stress UspA family protein
MTSSKNSLFEIRKILVPLEFDDRSKLLLQMAAGLASRMKARLVLLHVYSEFTHAPAHTTLEQMKRCNLRRRMEARNGLQSLIAESLDGGAERCRVSLVVTPGLLQDEVLKLADRLKVDLIFMSTHAYHGIKRVLLGSKSECILRRAGRPVLIAPEP